jgi:hypothetical protein
MKTETFVVTKITADDGKILTNGDVYGKVIVLGFGDSLDNYHEISTEEYEKLLEADAEVM